MGKISWTAAVSALAVSACAKPDVSIAVNSDTSAQAHESGYSDEDEAEHLRRFEALVASFSSGVGLISYDPTVRVEGKPDAGFDRTETPTITQEARQAAIEYAAENNSSALIIWRNGAIESETYFGDTTPETLLNSRSFAKPLTAIVVGRALQLGAIASLDQPVADFVKEWRDDPVKSNVTVRHLLDMRTGFLPQAAAFDPQHILNRAYLHPRHDEVIINDYPFVSEPGMRYDYSNATSEMIAPLIEAATGREYEEFLSTEVLSKIGASGGEIWINREGGMAHSGCCVLLPARDWLRLSVLLLQNGIWEGEHLLPSQFIDAMREGTSQNPYYGLGVWLAGEYTPERGIANPDRGEYTTLHSEPYEASDLFLWDGNGNQVSYIVPSEDVVILRMGKSPPNGTRWDNAKLPNLILRGLIGPNIGRKPQPSTEN